MQKNWFTKIVVQIRILKYIEELLRRHAYLINNNNFY